MKKCFQQRMPSEQKRTIWVPEKKLKADLMFSALHRAYQNKQTATQKFHAVKLLWKTACMAKILFYLENYRLEIGNFTKELLLWCYPDDIGKSLHWVTAIVCLFYEKWLQDW